MNRGMRRYRGGHRKPGGTRHGSDMHLVVQEAMLRHPRMLVHIVKTA